MAFEDVFKSIKVKSKVECFGDVNDDMKRPERYYLEEYFSQTPGLNADLAHATESTRVPRNKHFEILGTNGTSVLATFSTTRAGLVLTTATADDDQMILLPHLDAKQTAWSNIKWGTENQTIWDAMITTGDDVTTGVLYWAGLKLTNTPVIATDNDQVFFRYDTDVSSQTTWQVISSVGGVDTTTNSGVTVSADTTYRLKIVIDRDRKASFYINGQQVHKTGALTDNVDLIPYIGIQALSAAAEFINVHYEKISRLLFE